MVRHGEKECSITLLTSEGDEIQWRRTKKGGVSYRINDEEYNRLRGSIPDGLHKLLRMPVVDTNNSGDSIFDIHVGEQKTPIFLLNSTPANRAAFFASSSDAGKLIEMQKNHKKRTSESKTEERVLARNQTNLQSRVEALQPLSELEPSLKEVEELYTGLEEHTAAIQRLKQSLLKIESAEQSVVLLQRKSDALGKIPAPPTELPAKSLRRMVSSLESESLRQSCEAAVGKTLSQLTAAPAEHNLNSLSQIINRIQALDNQEKKDHHLQQSLSELSRPPQMNSTESLNRILQQIVSTSKSLYFCNQTSDAIRNLLPVPQAIDFQSIEKSIETIEQTQLEIQNHEQNSQLVKEQLADAESQLHSVADELEVCPVCKQTVDADLLIERVAISKEIAE